MGARLGGDLLRRTARDDLSAALAPFRAKVDQPVGRLDDVEVVFDHDDGVAFVAQPVEHIEQLCDIMEVQTRGGLIEDVERSAGGALCELARELYPLCFAAGESCRVLSEAHVRKANVSESLQPAGDRRHVLEETQRVLDRHLEDLMDALAAVADLECLAVITLAPAHIAGHVDVRQEVHLYLDDAITLTRLTTAALDVEAESPCVVAAGTRFRDRREQLTQRSEQPGVGGWIRARGASDRALVNVNDAIDLLQAFDALARRRLQHGAVEVCGGVAEQSVDDQRGFAGPGDSRHAGEKSQWDARADVPQIVARRPHNMQLLVAHGRCTQARQRDLALAAQILARDRGGVCLDIAGRALRDDVAAVHPRTRPEIEHMVRCEDRLRIVLDHDHGVAQIAQSFERAQQSLVVTLVQADRRLVQDVHDPGESRADLARQADALSFTAGERLGAAVEREIVEPNVDQKAQPLGDILHDLHGHFAAPAHEAQRAEELERLADGEMRRFRKAPVGDKDVARCAVEAGATAVRARARAEVLGELLAHRQRLGLTVAALQIGQNALEAMPLAHRAAFALVVAELDDVRAAAVEQHMLHVGCKLGPGRLDVEVVMARQGLNELEVIGVAAVPAPDRAARERQVRMHHYPLWIEELLDAQTIAGGARAGGVVE